MAVSAIFWTTEVALRSARLSSRETEHVQVFIRRPSLGLDQGNQHREPIGADLNHSTISSLVIFAILGPVSALGSLHAAKRFIGQLVMTRPVPPWASWQVPARL